MSGPRQDTPGVLYVVATPVGNLADCSRRMAEVLTAVTRVYAEDTRRTRVLLAHLGISQSVHSLHAHNECAQATQVLGLLEQGHDVALVSDAGTPGVSDPGAMVVTVALEAGVAVSPIPGPSALSAALSVSGFTGQNALFWGFLPVKGAARRQALAAVAIHSGPVVLFESPRRLARTLEELAAPDPLRQACVCRELTKVYEEVRRDTLEQLRAWAAAGVRGELTLVVGPRRASLKPSDEQPLVEALSRCLEVGLSARDAAAAVAAVLRVPKRRAYAHCQALLRGAKSRSNADG